MTPQAWFIGDDLGTNGGYALAYGTNSCPEDLPRTWEYWGFHTDQWVCTNILPTYWCTIVTYHNAR